MEQVTLREYRADDLEEVKRLVDLTIDTSYTDYYPQRAVEFFKAYHSQDAIASDATSGLCLVAESQGTIIATGALLGTNIRRVFVNPSLQGKGLGKMVMASLERAAVSHGIGKVDLDSSLPAKKFYDSLGFVTLSEGSHDVGDGELLRYYAMEKTL